MKEGRKPGWYFSPGKDSLCFGDGMRTAMVCGVVSGGESLGESKIDRC
jgi:hypothetical protein